MDLAQLSVALVGVAFVVAFLVLIFAIPLIILRKAGFPSWYVVPIVFTGYAGLIIFALSEWPIERELAWHRWKAGETSNDKLASIEAYAIDQEQRGEWNRAIEVYEELARRAPNSENAEYYRNSAQRLHLRMAADSDR